MDFVRLGAVGTTEYLPDKLIEGYNSLIWTERFETFSEFELKSYDVENLIKLLPEGTFVSHLETQVMQRVETIEINEVGEGEDARDEITIKGRCAGAILEHRWVESEYQKKRVMRRPYSATSAAGVLIWNAIDNASGKDVTRGDTDPDTEAMQNDYPWTTLDVIPNVAVTETVPVEGATRNWKLEEGMLWPQLQKILIDADLGLRVLRPVPSNTATVLTVATALATRGAITRTNTAGITAARFDIYKGVDNRNTVKFSRLQGHLDKPKYLSSNQEYKTVVEIRSSHGGADVYRPGENTLKGWNRRTMDFDGGTPELPPEPEKPAELRKNATKEQREARAEAMDKWIDKHAKWKNKVNRIVAAFKEENAAEALRVLKVQRRLSMFSSDISAIAPYNYRTHYNLGDLVTIIGDYGLDAVMVVGEYVRTEDEQGDRGFPGLVLP